MVIVGIFHQVAYAAAGTCVGGVVAGPPGALLGGMAGIVTFVNQVLLHL